jgi:quercetin dioxygenase-like cupin family protein
MTSNKRYLALYPCATMLLGALAGNAAAQQRTVLQTIDYPAGHRILSVLAELEPGQCTSRHSHPGAESAYVLEGKVVVKIDGKPDFPLEAGLPLRFAPNEVHTVCNVGDRRFRALAHYIVENDKPLVTPAPSLPSSPKE